MTPWARLPSKTGNNALIPHFWWPFFANTFPEIPNKNNTKETAIKGNIWVLIYMSKGGVWVAVK